MNLRHGARACDLAKLGETPSVASMESGKGFESGTSCFVLLFQGS